jgi:hypothetical protein
MAALILVNAALIIAFARETYRRRNVNPKHM